MISTILLFVYRVGTTYFLTFTVSGIVYYRKMYQEALMDEYSLERIRNFFKKVEPWLQLIYPIDDELNKPRGRPPTDRKFQLRFLLYWKLFEPKGQKTVIDRYKDSPNLQKILQEPKDGYSRSSMRRFIEVSGEERYRKILSTVIKKLIQKKWLDVKEVIIDSFPIYSHLNYKKCLKMPIFDKKLAKNFFMELKLNKIVTLFPKQHGRSLPLDNKLKAWIHHKLWDIPSDAINHRYIFDKPNRKNILMLQKGWKNVYTYRNFLKMLKNLPNYHKIEKEVIVEVHRVPKILQISKRKIDLKTIDDLSKLFHSPHRIKDKGSSLNYCAAKDHHFFGRGGLLIISKTLNLPLYTTVTSKYKQSEQEICNHLNSFFKKYKGLFQSSHFLADSEFGTSSIINLINKFTNIFPSIPRYGNSKSQLKSLIPLRKGRPLIETVLARLENSFHLEHPKCLGSVSISFHLNICILDDVFLTLFNLESGNIAHPHSFKYI